MEMTKEQFLEKWKKLDFNKPASKDQTAVFGMSAFEMPDFSKDALDQIKANREAIDNFEIPGVHEYELLSIEEMVRLTKEAVEDVSYEDIIKRTNDLYGRYSALLILYIVNKKAILGNVSRNISRVPIFSDFETAEKMIESEMDGVTPQFDHNAEKLSDAMGIPFNKMVKVSEYIRATLAPFANNLDRLSVSGAPEKLCKIFDEVSDFYMCNKKRSLVVEEAYKAFGNVGLAIATIF